MKRYLVLALTGWLLVAGGLIAWAGPGYGNGGPEDARWGCENQKGNFLDLSDEQREQIRALRAAERERIAPLREQMRQNRETMWQALANEPADEGTIRQMARTNADLKVDLLLVRKEFREKREALMTPEQLAKIEQRRNERGENRESRRGFGRHDGAPSRHEHGNDPGLETAR